MFPNISETNLTNFNVSHRQPKFFFGPLLGILLANVLSNSAFAKFAPLGAIRLEYDPLPFLNFPRPYTTSPPQPVTGKPELVEVITHSHHLTPKPELVEIVDHAPEEISTSNEYLIHESGGNNYYLESPPDKPFIYKKPEYTKEGIRDLTAQASNIELTETHDNSKFIGTELKNHVKRQIYRYPYNKYLKQGKRYSDYLQRKRFGIPSDYFEDDSYEDITRRYYRPNNRRRYQNGRRPVNFDDEYDDYFNDFDDDINPFRKPQRKNRNKLNTRNRQKTENDEESEFNDDVETVTQVAKPKQRQPTTTTMPPDTTEQTNITTGVKPSSNNTNGYGYGPSNGNENVSITYAPPTGQRPVYGPPSSGYGVPEYTPSSVYGLSSSSFGSLGYPSLSYGSPSITYGSFTPIQSYNTLSSSYGTHSTSYGTPSSSYGVPGSTYGKPSTNYGPPSTSYGTPSNTYGTPSNTYGVPSNSYGTPSNTYGVPSNTYATPSNSYGVPSGTSQTNVYEAPGYQSYQLPYSSWYKQGSSRVELARKAQDILSYSGLYKDNFK